MILNSQTQATIRRMIAARLPQTVTIRRTAYTVDDYGGRDESVSETTTRGLLTRLDRQAASQIAEQDKGRVHYHAQLPHDAAVQDGDQLVIDGVTYDIVQVETRHGLGVMQRAICVLAGS